MPIHSRVLSSLSLSLFVFGSFRKQHEQLIVRVLSAIRGLSRPVSGGGCCVEGSSGEIQRQWRIIAGLRDQIGTAKNADIHI